MAPRVQRLATHVRAPGPVHGLEHEEHGPGFVARADMVLGSIQDRQEALIRAVSQEPLGLSYRIGDEAAGTALDRVAEAEGEGRQSWHVDPSAAPLRSEQLPGERCEF